MIESSGPHHIDEFDEHLIIRVGVHRNHSHLCPRIRLGLAMLQTDGTVRQANGFFRRNGEKSLSASALDASATKSAATAAESTTCTLLAATATTTTTTGRLVVASELLVDLHGHKGFREFDCQRFISHVLNEDRTPASILRDDFRLQLSAIHPVKQFDAVRGGIKSGTGDGTITPRLRGISRGGTKQEQSTEANGPGKVSMTAQHKDKLPWR